MQPRGDVRSLTSTGELHRWPDRVIDLHLERLVAAGRALVAESCDSGRKPLTPPAAGSLPKWHAQEARKSIRTVALDSGDLLLSRPTR